MKQQIPILMYHSVGIPNKKWHWNYLTCPYKIFEQQLKWLKKHNYHTIHLNELHKYIFNNGKIPPKTIVLTFDDGYADNWIFAYPLLKKYGFKGTIFINPEFIDPRDIKRQRLYETEDVTELETIGFISWEELKEMGKEGIIDIQSHAMTHTYYPVSNKIVDFRNPEDTYIWLTWNQNQKEKPFLQIDNQRLKQLGEPVYEMNTSLRYKRFYPDKNLEKVLVDYVSNNGNVRFFNDPNWKTELSNLVKNYKKNNNFNESYENNEEFSKRIYEELKKSKDIIESKLNKKIEYLCWPSGSGSKEGVEIAKKLGYKMTTAAKDIPRIRKKIPNSPKLKINRIRRFSPVLYWNGIEGFDGKTKYMNGPELGLKIFAFKNILLSKYWANILLRLLRMFRK